MDIKPIETQYKGYRFRSRLEARWAVFFENLGVRWDYEPEGYEDGGIRYLPDFYLPEIEHFVEIKPFAEHVPYQRIYLAGKMGVHPDWRDVLSENTRERHERYNIIGPSYISRDGHDFHDSDIVEYCLGEIDSATLVYANFETTDTPGTIAELGFARAKEKTIVARFANQEIYDDLWFVRGLINPENSFVGGCVTDPLDGFLRSLSTEFKKCRMLSKNKRVVMMQGDPGNCTITLFANMEEHDWAKELKMFFRVFMNKTPNQVDTAIKKSRSARFEFGEEG